MQMETHDDLLDPEWQLPRRRSRLTVALVAALIFVLGFAGGVLTQRAVTGDARTVTSGPQQGAPPGGGVRVTR
jgi:hypothetical protein